mmetsp:Transcript_28867/g.52814  ORF Transcript_28867/g.52814 Transcript_28867/m.52814 type:complete len:267 (-) Transcript_28867:280-1080(-)
MSRTPPLSESIDRVIDDMWNESTNTIAGIDPGTENWKAQVLPLARIKKIMKSEEGVNAELEREKQAASGDGSTPVSSSSTRFMIAGEAPVLLGKACEMLVNELSLRAWRHTERNRRRTLQRQDVHAAVGESEVYDFLIDIVPRVQTSGEGKTYAGIGDQTQVSHLNPPADSTVLQSTVPPTGDNGVNMADAEMRLAQLQQMQEQYVRMHQRMQTEQQQQQGNGPPTSGQPLPARQMLVNPTMFTGAPQGAPSPWNPPASHLPEGTN